MLENGILALLAYVAFMVFFLFRAIRLIRARGIPLWQRLIPFPALALMVSEFVEVTTNVSSGLPTMTIFYLFIGLTGGLADRVPGEKKKFRSITGETDRR